MKTLWNVASSLYRLLHCDHDLYFSILICWSNRLQKRVWKSKARNQAWCWGDCTITEGSHSHKKSSNVAHTMHKVWSTICVSHGLEKASVGQWLYYLLPKRISLLVRRLSKSHSRDRFQHVHFDRAWVGLHISSPQSATSLISVCFSVAKTGLQIVRIVAVSEYASIYWLM